MPAFAGTGRMGFRANSWLGKFAIAALVAPFFAVFGDWHAP
jgi:hypothetical protein